MDLNYSYDLVIQKVNDPRSTLFDIDPTLFCRTNVSSMSIHEPLLLGRFTKIIPTSGTLLIVCSPFLGEPIHLAGLCLAWIGATIWQDKALIWLKYHESSCNIIEFLCRKVRTSFIIKMAYCQHRKFHYSYETVVKLSYLKKEITL